MEVHLAEEASTEATDLRRLNYFYQDIYASTDPIQTDWSGVDLRFHEGDSMVETGL